MQGWRSDESTRLPLMWPWFKSWRRLRLWVEFVVGSLLCSERFFSGFFGFLFSSKTNISKFLFDQGSGRRRNTMWMCYIQIVIYLFSSEGLVHYILVLTHKYFLSSQWIPALAPTYPLPGFAHTLKVLKNP